MRVLPHHQDTGGFFIAVLQKQNWLPWQRKRKQTKVTQEPTARTSDITTVASKTQNTDCSPQGTTTSLQDTTTLPQDTTTLPQDTTTLSQDTTTSLQGTTTSLQDTTTLPQDTTTLPQDTVNSGTGRVSMEGTSVMELASASQSPKEDVPTQLTQAATELGEEEGKEATADIPPEDRPPISVLGRYVCSPTSYCCLTQLSFAVLLGLAPSNGRTEGSRRTRMSSSRGTAIFVRLSSE